MMLDLAYHSAAAVVGIDTSLGCVLGSAVMQVPAASQ
jgi:hypothetical protein